MRIGIITVHDSANFGSFLQAYALMNVLQDMGHTVYFIKTRSRKELKRLFFGDRKDIKLYIKTFFFNIKKYRSFIKEINRLPELEVSRVSDNNLDLIIIGSDELWNVKTKLFTRKYFYGVNINVKNKICYGVSCGRATYDDFSKYPELVDGMKSINKIFIRDIHTKDVLKKLINRECEFTCDPTFLMDVDRFKKDYKNKISKPYMLVYSYYFNEVLKNSIISFAKENDLLIVAPCLNQSWADKNVDCSPLEFCELIRGSKFVVTTTFHGTIFSILNKKQFISIPASQKVEDVLKRTGMMEARINNNDDYSIFKKKLLTPLNFNIAQERILDMRKQSLKLLINEIGKYKSI